MNNNKQQTKGNKMKKIAMVIGVLTVMATSANAGYWTHTPTYGGYNYYSTGYNGLLTMVVIYYGGLFN